MHHILYLISIILPLFLIIYEVHKTIVYILQYEKLKWLT